METLITISKRTGFSISTVSRVLNNQAEKYRISKKTVDLVLREAQRCNYQPSMIAKGLRTKSTGTMGLLIPQVTSPHFAEVASVIIQEARRCGYSVITVDTMESEENERKEIATLLSHRVDGVIVVPCGTTAEHLQEVNRTVPVVLLDRYFSDTSLPYVTTDNYQGARKATELLITAGHQHILCIQGETHAIPNIMRVAGFRDALTEAGISSYGRVAGNAFSMQNGYIEAKFALASDQRPTAIFTLGNTILLGALKAIRESGMTIPDDISIVSFDNNQYLDFLQPPISRVSQQAADMGKMAVKLLVDRIHNSTAHMSTKLKLSPTLVVRDSVRPPKGQE